MAVITFMKSKWIEAAFPRAGDDLRGRDKNGFGEENWEDAMSGKADERSAATVLYRIHWKSLLTGATGHGTQGFPKDEAQRYCDALNRDPDVVRFTTQWIEQEVPNEH